MNEFWCAKNLNTPNWIRIPFEYPPNITANTPRIPTSGKHSSPLTHACEALISPSDARLSCPRLCPPTAWAGGRAVRPACGLSVRLSVGRSTGPPVGRWGDPLASSVRRPVDVYVYSSVCPSVRWSDVPPVRPSVHSLLGRWVGWSVGRNRRWGGGTYKKSEMFPARPGK